MSTNAKTIFYIIAIALFIIAAFTHRYSIRDGANRSPFWNVHWGWLGLAFAWFPAFWENLQA